MPGESNLSKFMKLVVEQPKEKVSEPKKNSKAPKPKTKKSKKASSHSS